MQTLTVGFSPASFQSSAFITRFNDLQISDEFFLSFFLVAAFVFLLVAFFIYRDFSTSSKQERALHRIRMRDLEKSFLRRKVH